MSRIAWADLMRAGMAGMGLKPDEFWRLTPAEFLLMQGGGGPGVLTRGGLTALSEQFPDRDKDDKDAGI